MAKDVRIGHYGSWLLPNMFTETLFSRIAEMWKWVKLEPDAATHASTIFNVSI